MSAGEGIIFLLVTFAIVAYCAVARPTSVRCPAGFYAEGVRPNGDTTCRRDSDRPAGFGARVYCTGGSIPIVSDRDGRTVNCTRAP